jgi:predicted DNA-binding mobile mystery protein A
MKKAHSAAQSRKHLDARLAEFARIVHPDAPVKGWIRAVRQSLGMTTAQLAARLAVSQPAITAIETSERRGTIELATLRRAADALNCRVVYALVPQSTLELTVRDRARAFARRRRAPVEHSMSLENQKVQDEDVEARLDGILGETNPRMFWD